MTQLAGEQRADGVAVLFGDDGHALSLLTGWCERYSGVVDGRGMGEADRAFKR